MSQMTHNKRVSPENPVAAEVVHQPAASSEYVQKGPRLSEVFQNCCDAHDVKTDSNILTILEKGFQNEVVNLDFSSNYLGLKCMQALLETLMDCPKLEVLSFAGNYLKPEIMPFLVKTAQTLPSLTTLNLSNNSTLGFSAAKQLVQLVKNNIRLVELDLEGTGIGPQAKDLITKLLMDNTTNQSFWERTPSASPRVKKKPVAVELDGSLLTPTATTPSAAPVSATPSPGFPGSLKIPKALMEDGPALQDLAQQNFEANSRLKEEVLLGETRMAGLHQNFNISIAEWHEELKTRHDTLDKMIAVYDEDVATPAYYHGYDLNRLMKDAGLDLSLETLKEFEDQYCVPPEQSAALDDIPHLLEEMRTWETGPERAKELEQEIENICYLREHKDVVPMTTRCYGLMHSELISVPHILTNVSALDEALHEAKKQPAIWDQKRREAVEAGDFALAEELHSELLVKHQELMEVAQKRIRILKDIKGAATLQKQARDFGLKAADRLEQAKHDAEECCRRVVSDYERLPPLRKERDAAMAQKEFDYQEYQERTLNNLKENEAMQEAIYKEIEKKFIELHDLGKHRIKEAESYVIEREKLEELRAEYNEFCIVYEEHMSLVERNRAAALKTTHVGEMFKFYFDQIPGVIERFAQDCWKQTKMMLNKEQRAYPPYFAAYMEDLAELICLREKRVAEYDRRIRNLDFTIAMCKDTLDPGEAKYQDQKKELEYQRDKVQGQTELLYLETDKAVEDFDDTGTEQLLLDDGEDFIHPKVLLTERITEIKSTMISKNRYILTQETQIIERDEDACEKSTSLVKQAKQATLHTLLPSLSESSPRAGKTLEPEAPSPRSKLIFS
uniref:Uncharacterized protein n=1 Tax=Eutreptiella gymnastica TaxID=73025 RepID=A0A7S1I1U3_9EUGL|mmetsp:Transcript_122600/g.212573  ORF Transcript_122600/g.212573 Transcript_122600/m.212573 type:complete len:846 (+) Transcript_122600:71-2608(+)